MINMPPRCRYLPCTTPAMPMCPVCGIHWQLAQGWNETTGEYEESLPFDTPVNDPHWDSACEAIGSADDPIARAG